LSMSQPSRGRGLPEGAKITYDVVPNKGKESAENLKVK
jgi:cold shock CspA family protein